MTNNKQGHVAEHRSTSSVIIATLGGTGALGVGFGAVADGIVKLHDDFGGGNKDAAASPDPQRQKKE